LFRQTYKATLINLFRSGLFWFILAVSVGLIAFNSVSQFKKGDMLTNYNYTYDAYIDVIMNLGCTKIMSYIMPFFIILSTVITINSSNNDNFFEIEKAYNMKPSKYFWGRMCALITVNFILVVIVSLGSVHLYTFTRGGVQMFGTLYYFIDSTIRVFRLILTLSWPAVLFYIGITYVFGCLIRTSYVFSFPSIIYIIFLASKNIIFYYSQANPIFVRFFDLFVPLPAALIKYMFWYDTFSEQTFHFLFNVNIYDTVIGVVFPIIIWIISSLTSYILTRRRTI